MKNETTVKLFQFGGGKKNYFHFTRALIWLECYHFLSAFKVVFKPFGLFLRRRKWKKDERSTFIYISNYY